MSHFGKTLVLALVLFCYSSYSYSQENSANLIPYSSIILQGNTKFSAGDGVIFGKAGGSVLYSGILTQNILDAANVPVKVNGIEYGWNYSLACIECKNYLTATSTFGSIYTKTYNLIGTGSIATKVTLGDLDLAKSTKFGLQFTGQQLWSEKAWQGPSIVNPYYRLTYSISENPIVSPRLTIPKEIPTQIFQTYIDPVKDAIPRLVQDPVVNQVLEKPETIREYQPPTVNRSLPTSSSVQEKSKSSTTTRISTQLVQQNNKQDTNELITIASITKDAPSLDQYQQQIILDATFYVVKDIYKNIQPVDNQKLLRGLATSSNLNHGRMVDEQYRSK